MPRRVILYVLLALAVPLPALALSGGGSAAPANIAVSASLGQCGTAGASVVCEINATWSEVAGATRYTASVTRADGSVVDFGDVGAGGNTFHVPYVGDGTYTVTVTAYGTPPGESEPEVIAKGSSDDGKKRGGSRTESLRSGAIDGGSAEAPADGDDGAPDGEDPPAEEPEEPDCDEPEGPPVSDPPPDGPGDGDGDSAAAGGDAGIVLGRSTAVPPSDECPEPEPAPAP